MKQQVANVARAWVWTVVLACGVAQADHFWDATSGEFHNEDHWLMGRVPGPGDTAIFNVAASYQVSFLAPATNLAAIVRDGQVLWNLSAPYTLTDPTTDNAADRVSFIVGHEAGDLTNLQVQGGSLTAQQGRIGNAADSDGLAIFTGQAHGNFDAGLDIGFAGVGELRVQSGATLVTASANIGRLAAGKGYAQVTGGNSSWEVAGMLNVGHAGGATWTFSTAGSSSRRPM